MNNASHAATQRDLQTDRLVGVLLGTAMGDSLGLPAENLHPARIQAFWGEKWRHHFLFGRGMVSDDTEHTALVASALFECADDVEVFRDRLAAGLRLWFACLPPGVGFATLKACLRLWGGISPERSGVYSAGNGPCMRSALLGAFYPDDVHQRRRFVAASTITTHTDPRALWAAEAIAEIAALEVSGRYAEVLALEILSSLSNNAEWRSAVESIRVHLGRKASVAELAKALGLERGVTGFCIHTATVAIYAWMRHRPSCEEALSAALSLGGDTDSVGAVVGGLAGAALGASGLPKAWVNGIFDWPFGVRRLNRLGSLLGERKRGSLPRHYRAPWTFWPLVAVRNLAVLLVILVHGGRRLLPPYTPSAPR